MPLLKIEMGGKGKKGKAPTQRIRLWNAATGKMLAVCDTTLPALGMPNEGIVDAAFSPDACILASCMANMGTGYLHLWDARSGRKVLEMKLTFSPKAIAFSRDGTRLAVAGGPIRQFGQSDGRDAGQLAAARGTEAVEIRVWDVVGPGSSGPEAQPKAP